MEQVRVVGRQTGIDAVAGAAVRYRGRVVVLCEGLLDLPEPAAQHLVNDLLECLDDPQSELRAAG